MQTRYIQIPLDCAVSVSSHMNCLASEGIPYGTGPCEGGVMSALMTNAKLAWASCRVSW